MSSPTSNQRMFHGEITAAALADQLAARFAERHRVARVSHAGASSLVQIGSKLGTPATIHLTDTSGGVLVTMSRDRDWLDKTSETMDLVRKASTDPWTFITLLPEVVNELSQENIVPQIWDVINDLCALTRSLAGEKGAPRNPKICEFCGTANDPELESCTACGAALPSDLPRKCPKCGRGHTSEALFCQACGTRLVDG